MASRSPHRPLSPHAWGWTEYIPSRFAEALGCPHTRGGGPQPGHLLLVWNARCPHTRGGGPRAVMLAALAAVVVPTRVGVDRHLARVQQRGHIVVPTRVGVDRCAYVDAGTFSSLSPHAWGWTEWEEQPGRGAGALSPHAWGWTAEPPHPGPGARRCPHTRGGGPADDDGPPTAGSVVPTRVGVDRDAHTPPRRGRTLSPHAWGWTATKAQRKLRLARCPHTRGGGPALAWLAIQAARVVPTRVGVDR